MKEILYEEDLHAALEQKGHKLVRDVDGEVDIMAYDYEDEESWGGHNGARCLICGEGWCEFCGYTLDEIEQCEGDH